MLRINLLCGLLLSLCQFLSAQDCPTAPFAILSQADADSFAINFPNCKNLEQPLYILGAEVNDLSAFSQLERVEGLEVSGNQSITHLTGFDHLEIIDGPLFIDLNDSLISLEAFPELLHAQDINVRGNPQLKSFNAFPKLQEATLLWFIDNPKLKEIGGFNQIQSVAQNGIKLENMPTLKTIPDFNSLSYSTSKLLIKNTGLVIIEGFNSIDSLNDIRIEDNTALSSLSGFSSLQVVQDDVYFQNNHSLTIVNSFPGLEYVGDQVYFNNHNVLDEIIGFDSLVFSRGLILLNSPITKVGDFPNLEEVADFLIGSNINLVSLPAFNKLSIARTVQYWEMPELTDISGLDGIVVDSIVDIELEYNPKLNVCDTEFFCEVVANPVVLSHTAISNNGPNCSDAVTIQNSCSTMSNGVDLELSLSQSTALPEQWSIYSVTATLTNAGDSMATGVVAEVINPAGIVFVGGNEWSSSQGTFTTYGNQQWTVGDMPPGTSASLQLNYFSLVPNVGETYAQVILTNETDIDSTPGNGLPPAVNEDDEASTNEDPPVVTLPDLILENLTGAFSAFPNTQVELTVDLINIGNADALGQFMINAYLSTDTILSYEDLLVGGVTTSNLAAGNVELINLTISIPSNISTGNYKLLLRADDFEKIVESNESNNILSSDLIIENEIPGGGVYLGCDVSYNLENGDLSLFGEGLNQAHYIVKLFSPTWTTIYNCIDICGNPILISNLTENGTYHIEITILDEDWNQICYTLQSIQINIPTSRVAASDLQTFTLFPNPVKDELTISIDKLDHEEMLLISNSLGQVIKTIPVHSNSDKQKLLLDVSNFAPGYYSVSLKRKVGKIESVPFVRVRD